LDASGESVVLNLIRPAMLENSRRRVNSTVRPSAGNSLGRRLL
jgi:hypothetical protein